MFSTHLHIVRSLTLGNKNIGKYQLSIYCVHHTLTLTLCRDFVLPLHILLYNIQPKCLTSSIDESWVLCSYTCNVHEKESLVYHNKIVIFLFLNCYFIYILCTIIHPVNTKNCTICIIICKSIFIYIPVVYFIIVYNSILCFIFGLVCNTVFHNKFKLEIIWEQKLKSRMLLDQLLS